ncbi:MAG: hypothetical protein ABEJ36_02405 [Candidatus Nanosalina sp.]
MKIEKLLKRLKVEFIKVNLIQASLDSILFFLTGNLLLFLINLQIIGTRRNYLIMAPISFLFFLGDLAYRIRNYHLEIYEEENPEMQEVLRTARDNIDQSNIASQALFDEVMERARNITSESIIPSKEIIKKIIAIGALSFLTVFSGLVNFHIQGNQLSIVEDLGLRDRDDADDARVINGSRILGDPADIEVNNRDMDFRISGKGKASRADFSFDSAVEEFSMQEFRERKSEDMKLAKQYSLAIKDLN